MANQIILSSCNFLIMHFPKLKGKIWLLRCNLFFALSLFSFFTVAQQRDGLNDAIVEILIEELHLEDQKIYDEFIVTTLHPKDKTKAIVIIPIINEINEKDDSYILDAYILVANSLTGKLQHSTFVKSFTKSDAISLSKINIDTSTYRIAENRDAFAVETHHRTLSQPNPYASTSTALFMAEGDELKMILEKYLIMEFTGEWDLNCKGESTQITKVIKETQRKTNDYTELGVTKVITMRKTYLEGEDCKVEVEKDSIQQIMIFKDGKYKTLQ